KLEFLQGLVGEVGIGQRNQRIKTDRKQPLDLAAMDGLHNLHGGQPTLRNLFGANAPDLRHVAACYGVANRALAGELVALLAVLTTTRPVAMAGNHGAARTLAAQVADGKAKINHREAVLYAFGMMLQAAGVQGDGPIRLREPAGSFLDSLGRHPRLLG